MKAKDTSELVNINQIIEGIRSSFLLHSIQGLGLILNHFEKAVWPRTISFLNNQTNRSEEENVGVLAFNRVY